MTMLRKIWSTLLIVALFGVVTPAWAQTKTFKIATLAPEGSDWMNQMKSGAKEIAEKTDGRVKFKFYGGGVMGNDKKVMRKIRNGQLHGGAFTAGSLADRVPGLNLYGLPFLFNDLEEVALVRKALDPYLQKELAKVGYASFGMASGGFAQIMSNKPVYSIDDIRGQRVWVPEGDTISYAAMERFGLSPVTLPVTDVLTGLQTGLIDVIGSSAIGALVLQWHTKVSHVSTMPVSYLFAVMVVEQKHMKKLTPADQKIVADVFTGVYQNLDKQNDIDNAKALDALKGSGIKIIEAEAGLLEKLKQQSRGLWAELAEKDVIPLDRLEQVEKILADHRAP